MVIIKIDYGSIIYGTAKNRTLNKLDVINNTASRIITGAFKSSPINPLLAEAGIEPLSVRRDQLLINYTASVLSNPGNQNHNEIKNNYYNKGKLSVKSNFTNLTKTLKINIPKILPIRTSLIEPWRIKTSDNIDPCMIDIINEHNENPNLIKVIYENKLNNEYKEYIPIYTSTSKINNQIGCAIISPLLAINTKFRLPSETSFISAEAWTIHKTLTLIEPLDLDKIIIQIL